MAADNLAAIAAPNDAILYGGEVTLWVRGDDGELETLGPRQSPAIRPPIMASRFAIFERFERDFYRVDPHLFSPAAVTFVNLDTGRTAPLW